jgi:hypothetical protein
MVLQEFLESRHRNAWIECPKGLSLYVRRNLLVPEKFELANMSCTDPGKGALREYLPVLEKALREHGFLVLFVENVLNDRLKTFLDRHGFVVASRDDAFLPCYKKVLREC